MDDFDSIRCKRGQELTTKIARFLEYNNVTIVEATASFFSILSSQIDSEEQILPICKALEKACYISIEIQKINNFDE